MATPEERDAALQAAEREGIGVALTPEGWVVVAKGRRIKAAGLHPDPTAALLAGEQAILQRRGADQDRDALRLFRFSQQTGTHGRPETRPDTDPEGDPIQVRTWRIFRNNSQVVPEIVDDSLAKALITAATRAGWEG